jgi:CRP-like cAMP-binding protein
MPEPADLTRSRVFDGLSDADRQAWLAAAARRQLRRGQTLARQGDPARSFYLVESGLLKLLQLSAEGHELIVRLVGPGEPFGGVVALDRADYPVGAVAIEPTVVREWTVERLRPLIERCPAVRLNLMREMASHMTDALTRVREISTERVGQRIAHALLRLMRQAGQRTSEGVLVPHALTRQELADLTGTTLFTVSRTLSQWTADGVLRPVGRRLLIVSPERLEELSQMTGDD